MSEVVWVTSALQDKLSIIQELVDIAAPRTHFTVDLGSDQLAFHCPVGTRHWSRKFEWPWVIQRADLKIRDVILEAGGGDTELQFYLAQRSAHVINFDHDQAPLDSSELQARRLGLPNLLCRRGDLASIYYPDNHFDKVFCVSVVEHIPEAEKAVDELWRVLKPGGRLLLTVDVIEHVQGQSSYLFDVERAQHLLDRWELKVPVFPPDGLRQWINEENRIGDKRVNCLTVLCVCVEKPKIS